jgi:hypothetical protein
MWKTSMERKVDIEELSQAVGNLAYSLPPIFGRSGFETPVWRDRVKENIDRRYDRGLVRGD